MRGSLQIVGKLGSDVESITDLVETKITMSNKVTSPLFMDNADQNVGNSPGPDGRGRIHTKISNDPDEPIPVQITGLIVSVETFLTRLRIQGQSLYRIQDGALVRGVFGQSLNLKVVDSGTVIVKVS